MRDWFIGFGVNDYTNAPLAGCVFDTRESLSRCISGWGAGVKFDYQNCRPCTDFRADREGMLHRIKQCVVLARPGDRVFITFSGHGVQRPTRSDESGEVDGLVEALCPYGFDPAKPSTYITDYELLEILGRFKENVNCVVLLDACFSGGIPSGESVARDVWVRAQTTSRSYPIGDNAAKNVGGSTAQRGSVIRGNALPNVAIISGCAENETCSEAFFDVEQVVRGAATKYFWQMVCEDPSATLQDVVVSMRAALEKNGFLQTPSIVGPDRLLQHPFMWDFGYEQT